MRRLLRSLERDYPEVRFVAAKRFCWSSATATVHYDTTARGTVGAWLLLHELGHALLAHNTYAADYHLVELEVAAWQKASELAAIYKCKINNDYVQDCLDSYRDWLYRRSLCPTCDTQTLQDGHNLYRCFNCQTRWRVAPSRLCRSYRRGISQKPPSAYIAPGGLQPPMQGPMS